MKHTGLNTQNKANFIQHLFAINKRWFYITAAGILIGLISTLPAVYAIKPVNLLFICFTAFVFLLTLINPTFSLLTTIALTPLNEVFYLDIGVKIRLYEILTLAMLGGWGLRTITGEGKLRSLNHNPLILPIAAILVTNILSLRNTVSASDSMIILAINTFLLLLYLLIYYHLYSVNIYKQALLVLVFVSNIAAIYGIYQSVAYFAGINFGLGPADKLANWAPNLWGRGRSFSTFAEPVEFAAYTMAVVLLLIPLLNTRYFQRWKPYIAISLIIQIIANILAMSRTAWLGLIAGVFLYLLLSFTKKKKKKIFNFSKTVLLIISIVFLLSVLLAMFFPRIYANLIDRTLQRHTYSTLSGRVKQVHSYIAEIPEHPVIGHGIGMGPEIGLQSLGLKTENHRGGSGPNVFVSIAFQTGILGLIAWIWLYFTFARKTLSALRQTSSGFFHPVLTSLFMATIAIVLTYQVNYFFIQPFFWVYLAFTMAAVRLSQSQNKCLTK